MVVAGKPVALMLWSHLLPIGATWQAAILAIWALWYIIRRMTKSEVPFKSRVAGSGWWAGGFLLMGGRLVVVVLLVLVVAISAS